MLSSTFCCFAVYVAKRPSASQRLKEKTNPEREQDVVEGRKLRVFKSVSVWTKGAVFVKTKCGTRGLLRRW